MQLRALPFLLWKKVLEDDREEITFMVFTFKRNARRETQVFREIMRMFDE